MENQEILDKRINRIFGKWIPWIKNPYNFALVLILAIALIIRLYYFVLTQHQPLWWDEAEYMLKGKAMFLGTPETGWAAQREIVIPILWGIFYAFTKSEFLPRLSQVVVSILVVWLTYLIAKEFYNKRIGLIAAAIISVNSIFLFFTVRLLVYLWAPLFFLLFFYFFWRGYVKKQGNKYLYFSAAIAAIGVSVYGSMAFSVLTILVFLIITEQHKFLMKKEIWIAGAIGLIFLIPQFIYNFLSYGNIFARWTAFHENVKPQRDYSLLMSYFKMFPHIFGTVFSVIILLGAVYLLFLILISLDIIVKKKSKLLMAHLFVMLAAATVLGFYTYAAVSGEAVYDAFILPSIPFLAIIGAQGIYLVYNIPFNKKILTLALILIILFGGFNQLDYSDKLIKNKITSFDAVKESGLWLKENSAENAIIISQSLPQVTYYAEREAYTIANSTENMVIQFNRLKPSFFIDSLYEPVENHVHEFPKKYETKLIPINVYYLDPQKQQPSLIIYQVNGTNF